MHQAQMNSRFWLFVHILRNTKYFLLMNQESGLRLHPHYDISDCGLLENLIINGVLNFVGSET